MDLINSLFELCASLFILGHVRTLCKDKLVRGVSVISTVFFFAWGIWNPFYYSSLNQPLSFYAGLAACAANGLWIGLMVYYKRAETRAASRSHSYE